MEKEEVKHMDVGSRVIIFLIGMFAGILLVKLMLHLEKLDWAQTRVYWGGFQDGYKKGLRDGKKSKGSEADDQ